MTEELIYKYITDQATPKEIEDVKNWMSVSSKNRDEIITVKNTWILTGLDTEIDEKEKEQAIQRIWGKIKAIDLKSKRKQLLLKRVTYAAVLLMVIGISSFIGYYVSEPRVFYPKRYAEVIVPYGERSNVLLPDGSMVHLNSGSKLRFKPSFESAKRNVILEGEAYFKIAHDVTRPFTVEAGDIKIEVLGTTFNVSNYADDAKVVTYLESGRVKIKMKDSQEILLNPEQAVEYDKNTGEIVKKNMNDSHLTDWTHGTLSINGEIIEVLSKILERRFDVNIIFGDERVKYLTYSGSIKDENLHTVLEALKFASKVQYKLDGKNVTLYSK